MRLTSFQYVTCLLGLVVMLMLAACRGDDAGRTSFTTPEEAYSGVLSEGIFSPIPASPIYPAGNPFSADKALLGELLFWDPILSGNKDIACASCHHPSHQWADGRAVSVGVGGHGLGPGRVGQNTTPRHSPSVLNVAFTGIMVSAADTFVSGPYLWDARAATLEKQVIEPIRSALEMRGDNYTVSDILPEVIHRLERNARYVELFARAFGTDAKISEKTIAQALATFQRGLTTGPTRFDQFLKGDTSALSLRELKGLNTFISAGCASCHNGPMLSDYKIDPSKPVIRNKPAVRTPGLRNVAVTAPYMHDGSHATLNSAIAFYEDRDDLGVILDEEDIAPIVAFLNVLTETNVYQNVPTAVPSGLAVGGNIRDRSP
ncbi:MAG: cytochrome c peroxidase [Pseudomonadota bacterium]